MPHLYYALVARQRVVLCDHALVQGSYETSSLAVLDKLANSREMKISFEVGSHVYHAVVSGGLVYLCVSDLVFDRSLAFGCLAEMERRLRNSPGLREKAEYVGPYALRSEFTDVLALVLSQYSSGDKLNHLQSQVTSVTGVMTRNLEKVMQRGETLDDLEDRSERLAHSSTDFRQSAVKLKRKVHCRNIKLWLIVLVVLAIILLIVTAAVVLGALAGTHKI